jgi:acyl-CoA synthetase (AMP-forming)/AMP-acid ligase II
LYFNLVLSHHQGTKSEEDLKNVGVAMMVLLVGAALAPNRHTTHNAFRARARAIMRLSQLLNDPARERRDASCVVQQQKDPQAADILTYGAAYIALQNHRRWLQEQVLKAIEPRTATHSSTDEGEPSSSFIVGYLASNSADFFLSVLACTDINDNEIIVTPTVLPALINTRWTVPEIVAVLETDSSSLDRTILLYGPGFAETAQKVVDKLQLQHPAWCLPLPTFAEQAFVSVPASDSFQDIANFTEDEMDQKMDSLATGSKGREDAVLVYTSGTTSGSKGVRLSHAAILIQAWAKLRQPCHYCVTTTMLATTIPFFHVGGLSSIAAVWLAGGTLVFPADDTHNGARATGFQPQQVWKSVTNHGNGSSLLVNTLVVVPAMLHALENNAPADIQSFPGVELILIGGQSAALSSIQFLSRVFPNARVVQTYACTEAASSLTFLDVKNYSPTLVDTGVAGDCVGVSPKHVQLGIFRTDQFGSRFVVHVPHTAGIIGTKGPHVMTGYWSRSKAKRNNNTVLGKQDWMFTNDLGYWDDQGRLYFCGRANDSIRTGGETVMALEVERVLFQHPDVVECAVFSLSDEKFGEAVCCALVSRGLELSLADIRNWCRECGLAGYKQPRRVFHVGELPKNSSGKILKFLLKERFADQAAATVQSRL